MVTSRPFPYLSLSLESENATETSAQKPKSLAQRRKLTLTKPLTNPLDRSDRELPQEFQAEYELGAQLGNGSVAVVKLAGRRSDGRQFAVKHVRGVDEEIRQFTRDEYDLVRTLSHPAIIKFEAMYENPCSLMICMELCSDGDVESFVRTNGGFTEESIRSLGLQMLRGVNHLHHKRVCHRDLKPENMLLQKNGSILKITDFNSAKRIGNCHGSSLMLTDRGTRDYAAPELRFGLCWNERVDIWSCGLCLYFMRRGALPFRIQDASVKTSLLKGKLPDVEWNGFSESLQSLAKQCLIVNMHDRPQAMELCWHRVFGNQRWTEGTAGRRRSKCHSGSSEKETLASHRLIEMFTFLPASGLLALHAGRFPCDLFPDALDSPLFGKDRASTSPEMSGALTCYQFEVFPSIKFCEGDQDVVQSPSMQMPTTYAKYRAPRHFDALLKLATHRE